MKTTVQRRHFLLGVLISATLCAWVLRRTDFGGVWQALEHASPILLLASLGLKLTAIWIKAFRWSVLLRPILNGRPRHPLRALVLGYFGNSVFPAKLGELLRIQLLRRHNTIDFAPVLATVALERSLDALVVTSLFAISSVSLSLPIWVHRGSVVAVVLGAGLLASLVALNTFRGRLPARLFPGRLGASIKQRGERLVGSFRNGLAALRSPRPIVLAAAITLGAWLVECGGTLLSIWAFHLGLPVRAGLVLTTVAALGLSAPAAPAGLGTHQFLYVVVLGWFGVGPDAALGLSLSAMGLMLAALASWGILVLWQEGLSLAIVTGRRD